MRRDAGLSSEKRAAAPSASANIKRRGNEKKRERKSKRRKRRRGEKVGGGGRADDVGEITVYARNFYRSYGENATATRRHVGVRNNYCRRARDRALPIYRTAMSPCPRQAFRIAPSTSRAASIRLRARGFKRRGSASRRSSKRPESYTYARRPARCKLHM